MGYNNKKLVIISTLVLILVTGCINFPDTRLANKSSNQQTNPNNAVDVLKDLNPKSKTFSIHIDSLPYGIDKKYENALREAISFWEKRADVTFREIDLENQADIKVSWVKEFGGKTLGHTIYTDFIEIGLGDSICLQKWKVYDYDTVLIIAQHELGHALGGKDDYENPNRIMYYSRTTKYETDIEETEVIPDGWARFYPICTKRDKAVYSFEVTSSEPLDVYVVPSKQEFELLQNKKRFNYYQDCYENKVKFYQTVCIIPKESGIILRNPTTFGLGKSAQFSIEIKEV